MAEETVYVKIDADGRYIERIPGPREIDVINLRARGFVPKGSKGAPTPPGESSKSSDAKPAQKTS